MKDQVTKKYFTTEEAANYLGVKESRLRNMRYLRKGPKCYKPGGTGRPL